MGAGQQALDGFRAGIRVAVDEREITTWDEFLTWIENKQSGEEVVLTIIRENKEVKVRIKLDEE